MRFAFAMGARFVRGQRGAVAVEFAMICLPLILFLIGTVEVGRVLYLHNSLAYAADVGARAMLVGKPEDVVVDEINAAFAGAGQLNPHFDNVKADNGSFRTLTISFPVSLLVPGLVSDGLVLEAERRLPE